MRIECNNTRYTYRQTATTDKNGYFISYLKVTNYAFGKCKVKLLYSPLRYCKRPSTLHGGDVGAALWPERPVSFRKSYQLFSVRPLAFDRKCPR